MSILYTDRKCYGAMFKGSFFGNQDKVTRTIIVLDIWYRLTLEI